MGAATAKRTRDHSRLVERAVERAAAAGVLAGAPVPAPAVQYPPLMLPAGYALEELEVTPAMFVVDVHTPELRGDGRRIAIYRGSSDEDAAARRAGLASGVAWGPTVMVAAAWTVPGTNDVQYGVLNGPLSAIRQALPDRQTLDDARSDGARYWPRPAGVHPVYNTPACEYVPLDEVLTSQRVELASRGLER